MSIQIAPRNKSSKEEIKEFLNAEHGKNDLTKDEVKKILEYDVYKVIDELNMQADLEEQPDTQEFVKNIMDNLGGIMDDLHNEVRNIYANSNLMINSSVVKFIKEAIEFFTNKGVKCKCDLNYFLDELAIDLEVIFSEEIVFNKSDFEFLKKMYTQSWINISTLPYESYTSISVRFHNLAKPILKGGE